MKTYFLTVLHYFCFQSLLAYDKFSEKITSYKNNIFTKWLNNAIEIERRQMQEVLLDFHANKLVSKFNV